MKMRRINLVDINLLVERLNFYHYTGSHKINAVPLPDGISVFMHHDNMRDTPLEKGLTKKEAYIYLLGIEHGDNIAHWR